MIGVIANEARIIGVKKTEGAVVYGDAMYGHVVCVHYAMSKADRLPFHHEFGGTLDNRFEQLQVGVFCLL